MVTLNITDFSCIESASLELSEITLIIGPQASGKSVICKLNYFFFDVLNQMHSNISEGLTFHQFKESIKERFLDWFPITAWGTNGFVIQFIAGDLELRFTRTSYKGKASDNFRIWTSSNFEE